MTTSCSLSFQDYLNIVCDLRVLLVAVSVRGRLTDLSHVWDVGGGEVEGEEDDPPGRSPPPGRARTAPCPAPRSSTLPEHRRT
jgi:hypothetical protein